MNSGVPFFMERPAGRPAIVYDSPHSGREYPPDFASIASPLELRWAEDAYVDELLRPSVAEGAAVLRKRTGEMGEALRSQGKLDEAKKGFVLLPKRWIVERSFAWMTRCRRLVKDYERYAQTLAGFHVVAFACIMLKRAAELMQSA